MTTVSVDEQLAAIREVHEACDSPGIDDWLFGGWAVDVHLGTVTREHADFDVAIWLADRRPSSRSCAGWRLSGEGEGYVEWDRGPLHAEVAFLVRDGLAGNQCGSHGSNVRPTCDTHRRDSPPDEEGCAHEGLRRPAHRPRRPRDGVRERWGVAAVARAAEAAGFDGVYSTEHPFPDDDWLASGGHQALDPFVGLSFAAAATTHLRVLTNLCVLPYRNPFLAARAAASLDVLSGGRLDLGVGAGYLEGEFRALGAEFENRNDRFDEAIAAITAAWSGESVRFAGDGYEARGNTMRPAPAQQPRPPVWIGGNSAPRCDAPPASATAGCPCPTRARSATAATPHTSKTSTICDDSWRA